MQLYEWIEVITAILIIAIVASLFIQTTKKNLEFKSAIILVALFLLQMWAKVKSGRNLDFLDYLVMAVILFYFIIRFIRYLLEKNLPDKQPSAKT